MAAISIRNLVKRYGNFTVIPDLSLEIADHEFVVFVGPSGCGKSTLLRIIAGLEPITAGELFIGDKRVNGIPAAQRDIAMVFQDYALYPHMRVYDNMAFALELRGMRESRDRRPGQAGGGHAAHRGLSRPQAQGAFGRPAPARRHGPRHRAQPAGVSVRRAAVEPRCQAARRR